MKDEINELLICNCSSIEHQLVFSTIADDPDRWVYVHVHLCGCPFFQRLWAGLKYIFGYKCKYGNFEEVILDESHADQLQKIVDYLKGKKTGKNGR